MLCIPREESLTLILPYPSDLDPLHLQQPVWRSSTDRDWTYSMMSLSTSRRTGPAGPVVPHLVIRRRCILQIRPLGVGSLHPSTSQTLFMRSSLPRCAPTFAAQLSEQYFFALLPLGLPQWSQSGVGLVGLIFSSVDPVRRSLA